MTQARPQPARRLLGVHSGALGDVVLFAQLLAALREPAGRVGLIAGGAKARLLKAIGAVDEALDFEALPMHEVFADSPSKPTSLADRVGRWDRLVSCFAAGDSVAAKRLAACTGARRSDFLPIRPAPDDDRHLVRGWAAQLRISDVPAPHWEAPPVMVAGGRAALSDAGADLTRSFAALHVGSGSPAKCWPTEAFERLADALPLPAVFLLGPVERERMAPPVIDGLVRRRCVLACPELDVLAGVLSAAAIVVGNDSGPAHLAAALGTPTLALFGPTRPANFAPRGRCAETLRHVPLKELRVDVVAAAARRLFC